MREKLKGNCFDEEKKWKKLVFRPLSSKKISQTEIHKISKPNNIETISSLFDQSNKKWHEDRYVWQNVYPPVLKML